MMSEFEILRSLWQWKLVSTAALTRRFFAGRPQSSGYLALSKLRRLGFIRYQYFEVKKLAAVWSLTPKGFKAVKPFLPKLREDGFRSETILHDWLVTAMHLGEWLPREPEGCALFSEQQLRRFPLEDYPSWIPKTDLHRPDGYWRVRLPQGVGTVALEVELSTKYAHDYRAVADFYRDHPKIFRVIWLAETLHTARTIQKRLQEGAPSHAAVHNFILKDEFFRHGWSANLHLGSESGRPLSFLLGSETITCAPHVSVCDLLDVRKSPHRTPSYAVEEQAPIRHRVGASPSISPPDSVAHRQSLRNIPKGGNVR